MGLEEGEIVRLERLVSGELPVLQDFEEGYRAAAAGFVEQNFAGGAEQVYDELPDEADMLPRYVDPPQVSEAELRDFSGQAALASNFSRLRAANISYAVEQLSGNSYMLIEDGRNSWRASDLAEVLGDYQECFEQVRGDLEGVAMFLDGSDELPGEPFNRIIHYKQISENSRDAAARADPRDISLPRESYWPFGSTGSEPREKLN